MSVQDTTDVFVGTPDELLQQRLRHASIEGLIQAVITLTHRVHAAAH